MYFFAVLGLVIAFRIIGFPDLTIEGSFTTGAAVGSLSVLGGFPPAVGLLFALLAGALAGACTGLIHTKLGVSKLLSGIIMMIALYSVNLRVMGSYSFMSTSGTSADWVEILRSATRPNLPLLNAPSLFDSIGPGWPRTGTLLIVAAVAILVVWYLLSTDFGLFLRVTGENPRVLTSSGLSVNLFVVVGLTLSNALIGFGGALVAQYQGFVDVGMSVGLIVSALASLLIGESIIRPRTVRRLLLAALTGSLIYQLILAVGLRLGIAPSDLKLVTSLLLVAAVVFRHRSLRGGDDTIGSEAI